MGKSDLTLDQIIKIELALREVLAFYGFKSKGEYYTARDKVYRDLPKDFRRDTGEYVVEYGENEKIARRATFEEITSGPTFRVPVLKFTRKQTEGGNNG